MPNDSHNQPGAQAEGPVGKITSQDVEDAWQAYAALRCAAQINTPLVENQYFTALQDTAFARFMLIFEAFCDE